VINLDTGEPMTGPCTGISANWCPNCGQCNCKWLDDFGIEERAVNCPLHGDHSQHALGPVE
jgi:hypothetical protein